MHNQAEHFNGFGFIDPGEERGAIFDLVLRVMLSNRCTHGLIFFEIYNIKLNNNINKEGLRLGEKQRRNI